MRSLVAATALAATGSTIAPIEVAWIAITGTSFLVTGYLWWTARSDLQDARHDARAAVRRLARADERRARVRFTRQLLLLAIGILAATQPSSTPSPHGSRVVGSAIVIALFWAAISDTYQAFRDLADRHALTEAEPTLAEDDRREEPPR